jgi:glycosyltransferase involved in cell wall biosynthesis
LKISILTPSFNSGRYVEQAIKSVVAQNDPDFEHIVVDGDSKDETVTILRKYPHLKWVSEPDKGQCDAMNKAFARSSGEIIAYLNSDDCFEPGVFAHVRDCFVNKPEADMVIGNFYSRDAGKTTGVLRTPVKDYRSTLLFFQYLWPLNPVSYFYRRRLQQAVGEFPATMNLEMDYWFLIRAMCKSCIQPSDLVFGTYFFPPESKTSRASGVAATQEAVRRLRNLVRQHLREDNPRLLAWWNAHWLFHYWVRGFPERAKMPFRYLAYKVLFSSTVDYNQYRELGFRRTYRERLCQHKQTI